ncbi:MAG: TetR/AcrR family transcriptional regulator [Chloroflexi bacterium]|nr:TetR/AcrR family transcriptional regulator [Chloroflexota bacterium]
MTTRRERNRLSTIEEIKSTAWKQIGELGAASLSLRAIAREMGMTAPGLYRYYADRDALVTALLIDAFDSFSAALESARDACPADDHAGRFFAIGRAYFQWGAANPQKYLFLFGTPISGYQFSGEVGPSAQRSFLVLQGVLGEAAAAGKLSGAVSTLGLPTSLQSQYEMLGQYGMPYTPEVTHLALTVWAVIHGITSLHLYNYLAGFLGGQMGAFIDHELEKLSRQLGLSQENP